MRGDSKDFEKAQGAWSEVFHKVLDHYSHGENESDLLEAKKIFFARLGNFHENREDLYEAVSQSFLEWYIYEFALTDSQKTPAVEYLTLELGSPEDLDCFRESLFHHWSLFEVVDSQASKLILKDLFYGKLRIVWQNLGTLQLNVKKKQIIQARLFHLPGDNIHFVTQLWLHPASQVAQLKALGLKQYKRWDLQKDFLLATFETVIRASVMGPNQNVEWLYRGLLKKYA